MNSRLVNAIIDVYLNADKGARLTWDDAFEILQALGLSSKEAAEKLVEVRHGK